MFVVIRIAIRDLRVVRARDVSLPWRLFSLTGVVIMTKSGFAARRHVCNLVLCSVATLGLAACGSGGGSGSSATASATSGSIPSLVHPTVGVIARAPGATTPGTPTPVASNSGPSTNTSKVPKPTPPVISTGATTLDWMPPTANSDGSVLTDLAGYTVYYGTSPSNMTQSVKITNPGLTAYTLTNLAPGTWYFAVTAYSSAGTESGRTSTVSTTI